MNLKELKEIIDLITSHNSIEEFEIEKSGVRVRIRKGGANNHSVSALMVAPGGAGSATAAQAIAPSAPTPVTEEHEDFSYIKSPIVGTFYRAPSPTSDPFISVGDFVQKGTPVCIIEAMKLMNEIESEVAGEIVAILVQNGQPVEYGENLFAVRPR
jgi:acetyl-CoA carboxylase biotin carboxyl carrier protein